MTTSQASDLRVEVSDHVATVELGRPPNNFFDFDLIRGIAEAYESLDADPGCRAIVLCSEGKHFCAGANFGERQGWSRDELDAHANSIYGEAVRLFRARKPVVAAVQGAAIGGGLGLALSADFRVACDEARFAANFARLGFHQGFGLSVTLPRTVGEQYAALMLFTGRRVKGPEAFEMGLADVIVERERVREAALGLAREIAGSAPLAVQSIRATLRDGLADAVERATAHELAEQSRLKQTEDFREGIAADAARREPGFVGR